MILTLAFMLLVAFTSLSFNVFLLGGCVIIDLLALLILGSYLGIGSNEQSDLTEYPE